MRQTMQKQKRKRKKRGGSGCKKETARKLPRRRSKMRRARPNQ